MLSETELQEQSEQGFIDAGYRVVVITEVSGITVEPTRRYVKDLDCAQLVTNGKDVWDTVGAGTF